YATAVVAKLWPDGKLEYVNCGHVPPLVIRKGEIVRLASANLPVGLLREATYESGVQQLEPGDKLLVVTDGVTEAENRSGEFFGSERLEDAARTSALHGRPSP